MTLMMPPGNGQMDVSVRRIIAFRRLTFDANVGVSSVVAQEKGVTVGLG